MRLFLMASLLSLVLAGCSGQSVEKQARQLGNREFTVQAWQGATQEERGEMLASLLDKHRLVGRPAKEAVALLGKPTAYYEYDENPAYVVGPGTVESESGDGYLLVFLTDKATGRITDIRLIRPT
jgi:hypothetical protein